VTGLRGAAAIAGIGATEFSKESGRSELQLACEAVSAALDDAGIAPGEVDGMVTFTAESSSENHVARNVGIGDLTFFSRVGHGGGAACGTVAHAVAAITAGLASVVVCWRAFNERSGERYGLGQAGRPMDTSADRAAYSWMTPYGLSTPAQWVAMFARRYMHEYGATSEDFGRVAVVDRAHAATNPQAWFHGRPITLEEHQASRWIAEPLHLLDCCQETDGGQALVVVSADRARDLPQRPAWILGAAQGQAADQHMMTSYYRRRSRACRRWASSATSSGGRAGCARPTSRPASSTTTSLRSCCRSSRSSASAPAARPGTSSPTATSRSVGHCR